jgi:hypothetical protein
MQEEEALDVYCADFFCHIVGEGGEGERQEMRGGRHGEIIEVMGRWKCIHFYWIDGCMRQEYRIEWCGGCNVNFWGEAVDGETVHGGDEGREIGRVMRAWHVVHRVQEDVEHRRILGDRYNLVGPFHGSGGQTVSEFVVGGGEENMGVGIEEDAVVREQYDVGRNGRVLGAGEESGGYRY